MAIKEISDYTLVSVPAVDDEFFILKEGKSTEVRKTTPSKIFESITKMGYASNNLDNILLGVQSGNLVKITISQLIDYLKLSTSGYVYGGSDGGYLQDTDEYNPDTWTSKSDMPLPARYRLAASTI